MWAKRVERWQRSGLSAREFAARHGLNGRTLAYWGWRVRTTSPVGSSAVVPVGGRFVEVVGALATPIAASARDDDEERGPAAELVGCGGLVVRVPVPCTAHEARRVAAFVAALEAR